MKARWPLALALFLTTSLATPPVFAGKADDTLNVAMAEEILNLDYNYTTKREYIILAELTDALDSDDHQQRQLAASLLWQNIAADQPRAKARRNGG